MSARKTTKRLYLIPVLSKALDILELLQAENQPMTLEAIHRRTRISKTTVYRVLKTFVHRGYLAQSPDGLYRQVTRPKKMRFGFAAQSADMPFSVEVAESLKDAAASVGVDLLVLDNKYDAATALKNAEEFVRSKVDLVIEFQVEEEVAPMIADKIAAANIPLIAIDIPHPHATYFGVDNYRVGVEAGEELGALCERQLGRQGGLGDRSGPSGGGATGAEPHHRCVHPLERGDAMLLIAIYFILLKLMLVVALALLFSCYTTPLLAILYTSALYIAGLFVEEMRTFHFATPNPPIEALLRGLSYLLPNFENFNVMAAAVHGREIPNALILQNTAYAALYSGIVLLVAAAVFSRRNLK